VHRLVTELPSERPSGRIPSKVHLLLALLLSGACAGTFASWLRFGDRFVLSPDTGSCRVSTLAVLNEGLRARHDRTAIRAVLSGRWSMALTWDWLLRLRQRGGCRDTPRCGKNLFLKFNTGRRARMAPAAGEALALKLAARRRSSLRSGSEGGLTLEAAERRTSVGARLSNLCSRRLERLGIDRVLLERGAGSPVDCSHLTGGGHRTEHGSEWRSMTRAVLGVLRGQSGSGTERGWFSAEGGLRQYDYQSTALPWRGTQSSSGGAQGVMTGTESSTRRRTSACRSLSCRPG